MWTAADRERDRPSLKDLDGVRVATEVVSAVALQPGFSDEALKTAVEGQLQAAGIRVLGIGVFPTGDPHLKLSVDVSEARSNLVAVHVQLEFVQTVFMRRDPSVTFNRAATWGAEARVGLAQSSQVARLIQDEVRRQVAQFVADYRAVN